MLHPKGRLKFTKKVVITLAQREDKTKRKKKTRRKEREQRSDIKLLNPHPPPTFILPTHRPNKKQEKTMNKEIQMTKLSNVCDTS